MYDPEDLVGKDVATLFITDPNTFWAAIVMAAQQLKLLPDEDAEILLIQLTRAASPGEETFCASRFFGRILRRLEAECAAEGEKETTEYEANPFLNTGKGKAETQAETPVPANWPEREDTGDARDKAGARFKVSGKSVEKDKRQQNE